MDSDDSMGRMLEALTLNRTIVDGEFPPYGGFGGAHLYWGHYCNRHGAVTEIWTNTNHQKHRIYGPAVKIIKGGRLFEEWYKDGILHRIGGPARIHEDNMFWYKEGKLHNLEGPAVIESAGPKQYWIDGIKFSPKQYKWEIARRKRKGLIK